MGSDGMMLIIDAHEHSTYFPSHAITLFAVLDMNATFSSQGAGQHQIMYILINDVLYFRKSLSV